MSKIPHGWQQINLYKIAQIQTGVAKGGKSPKNPIDLPYLRVANVQDGNLDLTEVKTITIDKSRVDRYKLQSGDVVLTEGGDFDKLGRGTVWNDEIRLCLHQNHVFAVRVDCSRLLPSFFALQAASPYGKQYFLSCAKRTTNLASINKTQLRKFPVLLPPLWEQRKIARILGTWDEAITVTEQLIQALERRKKGLMQRLLTGQVRFPEFQEQEWRHFHLSDVATVIMGQSPSSSNYNEEEIGLPLVQGNADIKDRRTRPRVYSTEITKTCEKNDVILSVRAPVGETALAVHNAVIGRGVCAIRAKKINSTPD